MLALTTVALAAAVVLAPSAVPADGSLLPAQLPASSGAVWHVSPTGSDTSPGTLDEPFLTLTKAFGVVQAGDTVLLRQGTYPEWVSLRRSGTAVAPITVRSYPGERATLTGRLRIRGSYQRVSGLEFVGGTDANLTDVLVYVSGADHVELSHNVVRGGAMSGIYVGDADDPSVDLQIIGNHILGNGTHANLDHGVYVDKAQGGLIANNLIEGNVAYGIQLYTDADGVIVTQNTIVGNGRSGVIVGGDATTASDGNLIVDNVIAFNTFNGVRSYWAGPVGTGNVVRANVGFGNADGDFPTHPVVASGLDFVDNTIADPLFADRSQGDYHVGPGSPAAGTSIPGYELPDDYDGRLRGTPATRGAFELAGEPVVPDFTLVAVSDPPGVFQGHAVGLDLSIAPTGGFDSPVSFTADGLPAGTTAGFGPNPATTSTSLTLTIAADTPTGTYPITVTGTAGSLTHTTTFSITVVAPPDFTLGAAPASVTVIRGQAVSAAVSVTPTGGFDGSVSLTASGLPAGTTATFAPNPATTASTLTVTTATSTPAGTYTIAVTGTSGSLTHDATLSLVVVAPPPTLSVSPTTVASRGRVTATWSNVQSPTRWNRISVHSVATGTRVSWVYTSSCTTQAGSTAKASGSCSIRMPSTAGQYELRLYANDTTLLAMSSPVTVRASG